MHGPLQFISTRYESTTTCSTIIDSAKFTIGESSRLPCVRCQPCSSVGWCLWQNSSPAPPARARQPSRPPQSAGRLLILHACDGDCQSKSSSFFLLCPLSLRRVDGAADWQRLDGLSERRHEREATLSTVIALNRDNSIQAICLQANDFDIGVAVYEKYDG